ncbi:unnamed protein product [Symbiodinium sp. CCMP2592]|nr:unnamed protein product [Symbiodinium sp. CCMP2592]
MLAVGSEKAEDVCAALVEALPARGLQQVQCVASDCASVKLYTNVRRILPNLQCMTLDPVHLPIVYENLGFFDKEYATWRKKTAGAVCLRKIMSKFNAVDSSLAAQRWGNFYRGYSSGGSGALSHVESVCRDYIETSAMSKVKARDIVDKLDTSKPFLSRFEFIEAVAALSATFPEDMNRKVTGANKRVAHILWCAADPDRTAWLFNNIRRRALALLPSGMSSNEALHAEVKNWFSETQQIHQSTLRLKLIILTIGKQIPHFLAMSNPTISQCSSRNLLARALANSLWTDALWQLWCSDLSQEVHAAKASLSYNESRKIEESKSREWNMKRPAAKKKSRVKRTVFKLKRRSGLRTQGVRKCI